MLPDSSNIQATHSGLLPLHRNLSVKAKTAHVLDGITNSSLVSIRQLCDDDCIAVLDKRKLQIFKFNEIVLEGTRNPTDGLWDIAIPISNLLSPSNQTVQPVGPDGKHHLNAIIRKDLSKTQLVQYLYGCCGSPVVTTWEKAIKNGNFITWPGIETLSIDAHLPKSIDSAKGHLNQEQKNLQSTRIQLPIVTIVELAPHGYYPCPYTTGLWKHASRPTKICLCVDDFGVKYFSTAADADHLLNSLRKITKFQSIGPAWIIVV
jgi:hypothetical protein